MRAFLRSECSKVLLRTPEIKVRIMKVAAITTGIGGFLLMFVAAMYASSLAQEFFNSEILGSSIFTGKHKLDMDQIRFELGGCIYAAFCISTLGMYFFLLIIRSIYMYYHNFKCY